MPRQTPKLLEMLRKLDKVTFNRFRKFVQSPYFNSNDDVSRLIQHLERFHPNFRDGDCARALVHDALFPNDAYVDTRIRLLFSEATKLIELFFSMEAFRNDPMAIDLRLLQSLRERNLPKLYAQHWRKVQKTSANNQQQSDREQMQALALARETALRPDEAYERSGDDFLQNWSDQLDRYFLQQKLKLSAGLLNSQQIFDHTVDVGLLPHTQAFLEHQSDKFGAAIHLYALQVRLLQNPEDETIYAQLKRDFLAEHDALYIDDQRQLHAAIRNHCVRRVNAGLSVYLQELFDWYRNGLDTGLLLANDELSPWEFKNIVSLALRIGELDWVERFIDDYNDSVPAPYSENVYAFSMARVDFDRQAYRSALRRLQTVAFDDLFYSLDARTLQAKAYFERTDYAPLAALLESFRRLLSRNKALSKQHKHIYGNFIKMMKKLMKLQPNDTAAVNQLAEMIIAERSLPDKRWFKEKLLEMGAEARILNPDN